MTLKQYIPEIDEKFHVHSFTVDRKNKLRLNYLTAFLQEAAWKHANHLDLGYDYMMQKNVAWMLSKMMIKIVDFPEWRDNIVIETWPKGIDGISYIRDFYVKNDKGKIICMATSYWLLVDIISKRPKAPEYHSEALTINKDKNAINTRLSKIVAKCENESGIIKPRYGDIDLNNHVNSNKYVEWIINVVSEKFETFHVDTFQINYLHEVAINQEITIRYSFDKENQMYFEGIINNTGNKSFQAFLKMK